MGTIKFMCPSCGASLTVPADKAGKKGKCLTCGTVVSIPEEGSTLGAGGRVAVMCKEVAANPRIVALREVPHHTEMAWRPGWPCWLIVLCAAVAVGFLIIIVGLLLRSPSFTATGLVGLVLVCGLGWLRVFLARSHAFRDGAEEVRLFFGLVKLILWNPTQGMLFLKNKKIDMVDNSVEDGGGVKFIFPAFGQELGLRVPLTVLMTELINEKISTRDSIPIDMKMTVWWKIADVRRFYLSASREKHVLRDNGEHRSYGDQNPGFRTENVSMDCRRRLEMAESWIRISMEDQVRQFVSGVTTSLLISDRIAALVSDRSPAEGTAQLPAQPREQIPPSNGPEGPVESSLAKYQTASNLLVQQVRPVLDAVLEEKGLVIDGISLQEVSLPPEIQKKAIDAAKAWYKAIELHREGVGQASQLEELSRVIGVDSVSTAHVLKQYKGTNISVGISGVLDMLFAKIGQKSVG